MYRTRLFLLTTLIVIVLVSFVALLHAYHVRPSSHLPPIPGTSHPGDGIALRIPGQDTSEPNDNEKLKLSAPATMEVGELVRLSLAGSEATGFKWRIKPHTTDFEVFEQGLRAHLTARPNGPESFLLMISGAGMDADGKPNGESYLIWKEIHVEGLEPAGPRTLAHDVSDWTRSIKPYEGRLAHLKAMANLFKEAALDKTTDAADMENATAIAATATLGQKLIAEDGAWTPFLDKLGTKIDELKAAGELETREQFEAVWLEISRGLERATK